MTMRMDNIKSKEKDSVSVSDEEVSSLSEVEDTLESDKEHTKAPKYDLTQEKVKRYSFLLGKSKLFSQFIKLKQIPGLEEKIQAFDKKKASTKSDARHRKTEAEEDAEILKENVEDSQITVFTESPFYIQGKMRDYQVQGLNWMVSLYENGLNGILADEMGLGKTLQTISFLGFLRHYRSTTGPHLILVPKTTLHNWLNEFQRWMPEVNAFIFHGLKEDRPGLVNSRLKPVDFDVCITSYEMVMLEKTQFGKIQWEYMVIDEAHRIKNESSLLSKIIRILDTKYRLLVTGTPLQNNLHELWALLNFLLPDVFGDSQQFEEWFQNQSADDDSVVKQLHQILQPFLLRRIKLDVEKSLLPKKEINLYVGMSSMQRKWYQKLLEKDIEAVNGVVGKREGSTRLLNIVMQLRKCCNHPYLFDGAEPGPPFTTDEHLVDNSGKMLVLDRLLKHLKSKGSRVLIFSQMSRMLDILEDYCVYRDYGFCRIDGSTSHEDRIAAIDDYNRPDSDKFLFLLTTRAGGLGINLVTADIVIIYDSDWNPQVDLQAQDRAHRIGQTKQVYVFRLITENAVEEKVIEKANRKLRLDQLVIQQGRAAPQTKGNSKEELLGMIQHGAKGVFGSTDSTIVDNDIEAIIQRGEQKTLELQAKFQEIGFDDLQNFSTEQGATYVWEGEDYSNKRKPDAANLGINWINPAKRERKANYDVDNYYRETLRVGPPKSSAPKPPRPPKQPQIHDFQFFPQELFVLFEKEILSYQRSIKYVIPEPQDEEDSPEKAAKRAEDQAKIDGAEPLTEEEVSKKELYLTQGFTSWSRRDFRSFIAASEKHGRDNLDLIADDIEGKTFDEVKEYHQVFWKKYNQLADYERIIDGIEKGEERLRRQAEIQNIIRAKVGQCAAPLVQLKVPYLTKGKTYSEDEDRFLLVMMDQHGHGSEDVYDKIRDEIRRAPLFRFNWFFKSRTPAEIGKRCLSLINMLLREKSESGGSDSLPKLDKVVKRTKV